MLVTFTHILFWNLFEKNSITEWKWKKLFLWITLCWKPAHSTRVLFSRLFLEGSKATKKKTNKKNPLWSEDKKNVLMHICKLSFFIVSYFHESSKWIITHKVFFALIYSCGVKWCGVCVSYRCLSTSFIPKKWITCPFGFHDWCFREWYSNLLCLMVRWSPSESHHYSSFKLLQK